MKITPASARVRRTGAAWVAGAALLAAAGSAHASSPPYIIQPSLGSNAVQVFDQATGQPVRTVSVPDHPFIANATSDGRKVYFDPLGLVGSHVSIVDTGTWNVKTIPLNGLPFATILSPDDTKLYILQANGLVSVVDTRIDKIVQRWNLGFVGAGLEISPDGKTIYISFVDSTVAAYDAATGRKIKRPISTQGLVPAWLSISEDGRRLYALNWTSGTTAVLDTATWKQIGYIDEKGAAPAIAAESPDGTKVYISDASERAVDIYRTTDFRKVGSIRTKGLAMSVNRGPDGYIYANDWGSTSARFPTNGGATVFFLVNSQTGTLFNKSPGTLSKIDPTTDTVVQTIRTNPSPVMLDFIPARR